MTFQMSDKAILEEEIMEAISFYKYFVEGSEEIQAAINKNGQLDHENDSIRSEVTRHLLSALSAFNMRDYQDMERHVQAALQRLHAQEVIDYKDDKPRTDALIKLSIFTAKAQSLSERLRRFLGRLNGERKI